jgi:hypothetical protein
MPTIRLILPRQICLSQRELYYLLIHIFKNQRDLNNTLLDACATLGVPRFALNIGSASRGVLAGCIRIGPPNSAAVIDGEYVGTVRGLVILSALVTGRSLQHGMYFTMYVLANWLADVIMFSNRLGLNTDRLANIRRLAAGPCHTSPISCALYHCD